jgi:hypothetical protein
LEQDPGFKVLRLLKTVAKAYTQAFFAFVGFLAGANPNLINETLFVVPNVFWIGFVPVAIVIVTFFLKRSWLIGMLRLYVRAIRWFGTIFETVYFGTILIIPTNSAQFLPISFALFTIVALTLIVTDGLAGIVNTLSSKLKRITTDSEEQPDRKVFSKIKDSVIGGAIIVFAIVLWLQGFVNLDRSIVAIAVSAMIPVIYLMLFFRLEDHGLERSPTIWPEDLWREHRILDQSVSRRENSILITGSIFVTASLLLLGQSASVVSVQPSDLALRETMRGVAVFTSWFMYSIWLFFLQFPAGRLTDWSFKRLRGIETQLGIQGHLYIVRQRDPFRRYVWLWVLNGLFVAGYAVLDVNLLYLEIFIPVQILSIVLYTQIQWCPNCGKRIGWKRRAPKKCPICGATGDASEAANRSKFV